jgi:tetratricopeptide (TPR) repeat protein
MKQRIIYFIFLLLISCQGKQDNAPIESKVDNTTKFKLVNIQFKDSLADSFYERSIDFRKNGFFDSAKIYTRKALFLEENNPLPLMHLGWIHWKHDNLDSGIYFYKKTIDKFPSYSPAYSNLGLILIENGKENQAISYLNLGVKVAQSNDELVSCYFNLIVAYTNLGECESANRFYMNLHPICNEHPELINQIKEYLNENCN